MTQSVPVPAGAPRGLDHLVIAGRALDRMADFYRSIGFTVGVRNQHPWGTENHIIQFDGAFLELISVGKAATIRPRAERVYSFGGFVRDYLRDGDGMAMMVLESRDARADAHAFSAARLGDFEPFFFERMGKNAAGESVRVAFTLAFAEMPQAPRAGFFVCQQHEPQNFWSPAAQVHKNSATGIDRVTMVADDPSDCHEFLGGFVGQRTMRATSFGLELDTGRGMIEVLSPDAFRFRFGQDAPIRPGKGPQFAAVTFRVSSLRALETAMAGTTAARTVRPDGVTIAAAADHGLVLSFIQG
jgi:catechol 2,3-dioxygenase-like lactoylglutathione lyase family enzyme